MKKEVLRIENGFVKPEDSTVILTNIYLQVFTGEALGIIFYNLEEKSALIQLLRGNESLSRGRLYLNENVMSSDTTHKLRENIFIITESSNLLSRLKIYENILIPSAKNPFINYKTYRKITLELFQKFNINITIEKPVKRLSNLERVTIELLRAYVSGCKLLVISNITGILSSTDLDSFFSLISKFKKTGISFIFLDTYEDIIFDQTDNLAIIKNGKTVGIFDSSQIDRKKIYQLLYRDIISKDNEFFISKSSYANAENVILSFNNVSDGILDKASFDIRRGEIIKILYIDDASKNDLIGNLKGKSHAKEGQIYLNGQPYSINSIKEAQSKGVCFIEEKALDKMLFKNLNVMYNLCFHLSKKVSRFWSKRKYSKSVVKSLDGLIDSCYFKKLIFNLPPTILQKIVYCQWFLYSPKVLVCINPFSIADIKLNQTTEQMIKLLASKGISIIILTSNWPSMVSIKGKVFYLKNGKLTTD